MVEVDAIIVVVALPISRFLSFFPKPFGDSRSGTMENSLL
jgi:hypothetical protein